MKGELWQLFACGEVEWRIPMTNEVSCTMPREVRFTALKPVRIGRMSIRPSSRLLIPLVPNTSSTLCPLLSAAPRNSLPAYTSYRQKTPAAVHARYLPQG